MYSLDRNRLKSAVDAFDLLTAVCQRDVYLAGLEELCSGQLCRIVVLRCGSDHGAFCDFNTISCKKRLKLGARVFVMRYFALSIDKVAFKSLSPDIFPGNGYLFAAAGKDQYSFEIRFLVSRRLVCCRNTWIFEAVGTGG